GHSAAPGGRGRAAPCRPRPGPASPRRHVQSRPRPTPAPGPATKNLGGRQTRRKPPSRVAGTRGKARRKSGNGRPVAGKQANPLARRQRPAGPRTPRTPLLPYPRRRKVNLATVEGNRQVFGLSSRGAYRRAPNLLAVA